RSRECTSRVRRVRAATCPRSRPKGPHTPRSPTTGFVSYQTLALLREVSQRSLLTLLQPSNPTSRRMPSVPTRMSTAAWLTSFSDGNRLTQPLSVEGDSCSTLHWRIGAVLTAKHGTC